MSEEEFIRDALNQIKQTQADQTKTLNTLSVNLAEVKGTTRATSKRIDVHRVELNELDVCAKQYSICIANIKKDIAELQKDVKSHIDDPFVHTKTRSAKKSLVVGGSIGGGAVVVWEAIKYLISLFR